MSGDPGKQIEVVTVFHNAHNKQLTADLVDSLAYWEPGIKVHTVDNTRNNRGFSKACNLGAIWCESPVVGFLNPDVEIKGTFAGRVVKALEDPDTVIAGNGYGKPAREVRIWGIKTFICGACMFVERKWFESVDGFDQRFVWSHEETDLIRRAEAEGKTVKELKLPITHASPSHDSQEDAEYKRHHFDRGARLYRKKWTGVEHLPKYTKYGRH